MKRIICALLTVVMLAAMIPSFAMTAAAADPVCPDAPAGFIPVSMVSQTPADNAVLAKAFDVTNEDRIYLRNVEIVGKFATPTKVTNVIFNPQYYPQRLNGTVVYLSVDGTIWTEVLSIRTAGGQGWYMYTSATYDLFTDGTEYNYVKIVQPGEYDCKWVAFYNNDHTGRLNVTHVSGTDNICNASSADKVQCEHENCWETKTDLVDWSSIWDVNTTVRHGYQFTNAVEIVGKFDAPTAVNRVVLDSVYHHYRLNGIKIYLSSDNGATWVSQLGLTKIVDAGSSFKKFDLYIDGGITKWTHIKITQETKDSNNNYPFDIRSIAVYNDVSPKFEKVYPISTAILTDKTDKNAYAAALTAGNLWNYQGCTTPLYIKYDNEAKKGQNTVVTTAEFATPTVVSKIYLKIQAGYAARANHMILQGSVDGQTWVQLNKTDGAPDAREVVITCADKTAYKYIRLIKGNNYGSFGLTSIGVVGTPTAPEANTTEADFYGVQTKVDADAWALRLISTVDSLDFKAVGYEIKVTGLDKDGAAVEKFFDEYTQTVYSSVIDNMGTRNAKALGGNYIFTATINGISIEKYAALTFEIKPYVADEKGQKTYGETQTYTFEDGVQK